MPGTQAVPDFNPIDVVSALLSDFEKQNRLQFSPAARQKFLTPAIEHREEILRKIQAKESTTDEMKAALHEILWDAVRVVAPDGFTAMNATIELDALDIAMMTCRWFPWC